MCRRFAKRKGGLSKCFITRWQAFNNPQEVRVCNQGFNENVKRAYIPVGFCNLVPEDSWIYSTFDNIFLSETIACLIQPNLQAIKLFRRGNKRKTKSCKSEITERQREAEFMRVIKFCWNLFRVCTRILGKFQWKVKNEWSNVIHKKYTRYFYVT